MRWIAIAACVLALAACGPRDRQEQQPGQAKVELSPEAKAFLEKNAKEPGVKTTASGLQYKVVREGPAGGERPTPMDEVRVHYEGTLLDGTVFDSSYKEGQPVVFRLGNVIPGWIEGVGLMKPGDEYILFIPPELGYGAEGAPPVIPPNAVLTFRIELLGVLKAGGGQATG